MVAKVVPSALVCLALLVLEEGYAPIRRATSLACSDDEQACVVQVDRYRTADMPARLQVAIDRTSQTALATVRVSSGTVMATSDYPRGQDVTVAELTLPANAAALGPLTVSLTRRAQTHSRNPDVVLGTDQLEVPINTVTPLGRAVARGAIVAWLALALYMWSAGYAAFERWRRATGVLATARARVVAALLGGAPLAGLFAYVVVVPFALTPLGVTSTEAIAATIVAWIAVPLATVWWRVWRRRSELALAPAAVA